MHRMAPVSVHCKTEKNTNLGATLTEQLLEVGAGGRKEHLVAPDSLSSGTGEADIDEA